MAKNVLVLQHFEQPKKVGNHHRLLTLTGDLKGKSFYVTGNRVVIGRDPNADITLRDIKASREHIELVQVGESLILTDLGSQNGVIVNDLKVRQHRLKDGDKIIVGQTVFKYSLIQIAPPPALKSDQNVVEAQSSASVSKQESFSKEMPKKDSKTKLLYIVIALGLGLLLLDSGDSGKEKGESRFRKESNLIDDITYESAARIMRRERLKDKKMNEELNIIFNRGLRELREKNYLRALEEFDMALIMNPTDSVAQFYRRKAEDSLYKAIEEKEILAERDKSSLHFREAIVSYCAIMRMLYRTPSDQKYKDARKNILKLEEKLGYEPGEINCIEK